MRQLTVAAIALAGTLFASAAGVAQDSDAELYERLCSSCHSLNPGALAMQGPHLRGVYGRKAGTVRGYLYSAALKNFGAVWDEATMYGYLTDPSHYVEGTKKRTGIKDGKQVNRVVKFLEAT